MKCLIIDTEHYKSEVISLSERGVGEIVTDPHRAQPLEASNATAIFITVKNFDEKTEIREILADLRRDIEELGHGTVIVCPFAHLSCDLAPMKRAREIIYEIVQELRHESDLEVLHDHFGSDKRLEAVWAGKPGAVRFRSTS